MNYYFLGLKKYATFSGRASIAEYWYFFLFNLIIFLLLGVIEGLLGIAPETDESVLPGMYQLIILIPTIAVGVRRMHDVNISGWCIVIPFYNLIMLATPGTKGNNKYGPEPKYKK